MTDTYKEFLRQQMLAKRLLVDPQEASVCADLVARRMEIFLNYRNAKTFMCYIPIQGEVDTIPIIQNCIRDGKKVILPVLEDAEIKPCIFRDFESLTAGKFNILEPAERDYIDPTEIDAICVPGLAFNLGRYRLGFGKGYYDRFLPKLREDCFKVGLAFDFQVVPVLPIEAHDVRLDMILTEQQFIGNRSY